MAHHRYGFSLVLQQEFDRGFDSPPQGFGGRSAVGPDSHRSGLGLPYQEQWDDAEQEFKAALGDRIAAISRPCGIAAGSTCTKGVRFRPPAS